MGFTIDMVNGEILDESSIQESKEWDYNKPATEFSESGLSEQLVSIAELGFEETYEIGMPESVSQIDIDSFLDKFS